jgi:hypothetical protein
MTSTEANAAVDAVIKREGECLAREFKDHKASLIGLLCTDSVTVDWRKPGTGVMAIRYRIDGKYLLVTGDMGDAIFAWSQPISFRFFANCGLDYFKEKCVAKPADIEARFFDTWCDHELRLTVDGQLEVMKDDEEDPEKIGELQGAFESFGYDRQEWQQFLCSGNLKMDGELLSILYNGGYRTHTRCRAMLLGLQMVHKQLEKMGIQA